MPLQDQRFEDRYDAGRRLGEVLARRAYGDTPDTLVLALPRGGVPVAYEVAKRLNAPMDVFLVRKLGLPGHEELAMGAIAANREIVLNPDVVERARVNRDEILRVARAEWEELQRREREYRGQRPPPDVRGKTVILIDDGLATGATMRAAARALRAQNPAKLLVAVPVSAPETCEEFRGEVDDIICAVTPRPFAAVGMWYHDFSPTTDEEVRDLLRRRTREMEARHGDVQHIT